MPNDMRDLWQGQQVENVAISLQAIRRKAAVLRWRIRVRNSIEYTAGAVMIVALGVIASRLQGWHRLPSLILAAGIAYVLYQLHRRAAAPIARSYDGLRASIASHRQEVERQRDALQSVWLWYLLPLVPGVVAMCLDGAISHGVNWRYGAAVAYFIVSFAAVWMLNRSAARRLDRQVRDLKAMEENDE